MICDYFNDEKLLDGIQLFIKNHIHKLNPFEVLDLCKNLADECIERLADFDGRVSDKNVNRIRRMKLDSFTILFNAAVTKFNKPEMIRLMTLSLV